MERLVVDLVLDSDRLSSLIARSNELLTAAATVAFVVFLHRPTSSRLLYVIKKKNKKK
jgi:hypothetical protein